MINPNTVKYAFEQKKRSLRGIPVMDKKNCPYGFLGIYLYMAVCQNLVPLVNIKIAGKWMFIPLKMVLIGIDPYPYMDL